MDIISQYIFLKQNNTTRAKCRPAFRSNAVCQCTKAHPAKRHNHSNRGYFKNFAPSYFHNLKLELYKAKTNNLTKAFIISTSQVTVNN